MSFDDKVNVRVTLSFQERRVLLMLADRGRRQIMRKPEDFEDKRVTTMMNELKGANLITIEQTVESGPDRREYYLTDLGVQIVDQMKIKLKQEVEDERKKRGDVVEE